MFLERPIWGFVLAAGWFYFLNSSSHKEAKYDQEAVEKFLPVEITATRKTGPTQ